MNQTKENIHMVIVTGMSGAGKTQAIKFFEDMGYFCVDNLPPALLPKMAELCVQSEGKVGRLALGIDIRGGHFFASTISALEELERAGFHFQILFLEASEEVLVRRYKETRHRHPLAPQGRVLDGIRKEQNLLEDLRGRANHILDTSSFSAKQFGQELQGLFNREEEGPPLAVTVLSFGFKHGLPLDADLVFDVRFLPNPHYVPSLKNLTGLDEPVQEYVYRWPVTSQFYRRLTNLLAFLLPQFVTEGKTALTIAIGCTGGQHRSVALADRLATWIKERGYMAMAQHRDVPRVALREER